VAPQRSLIAIRRIARAPSVPNTPTPRSMRRAIPPGDLTFTHISGCTPGAGSVISVLAAGKRQASLFF
jgi:hypothetical protein